MKPRSGEVYLYQAQEDPDIKEEPAIEIQFVTWAMNPWCLTSNRWNFLVWISSYGHEIMGIANLTWIIIKLVQNHACQWCRNHGVAPYWFSWPWPVLSWHECDSSRLSRHWSLLYCMYRLASNSNFAMCKQWMQLSVKISCNQCPPIQKHLSMPPLAVLYMSVLLHADLRGKK